MRWIPCQYQTQAVMIANLQGYAESSINCYISVEDEMALAIHSSKQPLVVLYWSYGYQQ